MIFSENYKKIKETNPIGFRGYCRNIALDGLAFINQLKDTKAILEKPRIQFLYIHHIFKDEEHKLDLLLKKLSVNHTFISYGDAINKIVENKIDKPYICISSDDGFKNNIAAAKILNEYNAKACFFINPGIVGNDSFLEIEKYCKAKLNFPPVEFMSWKDVEQLQQWGHEIGSHTMNHINVANTAKEIFVDDCTNSFEILNKMCGEAKHFAFPYGRFFHFNEGSREIVFNAGFISCASAERGCHINDVRVLKNEEVCILRDHVILDWNMNHIIYFLLNNSKKASFSNNLFPYSK